MESIPYDTGSTTLGSVVKVSLLCVSVVMSLLLAAVLAGCATARSRHEAFYRKVNEAFKETRGRPGTPLQKKRVYEGVLKLLEEYPAQPRSTEYAAELSELETRILKEIDACEAYEALRTGVAQLAMNRDYEAAIAQLNKFPQEFRDSEMEQYRQKLLTKYSEAFGEQQARKREIESLTYYELYRGESLEESDWFGGNAWKVKEGVLVGKTGPGSQSSLGYSGAKDWKDLVLRIRMKLVRGQITVGVRGTEVAALVYRYDPIAISNEILPAGEWCTLTVKLRGDKYYVTAGPLLAFSQELSAEKEQGPVAIFIKKESEVHIEWIKVGFFDEVPVSFAQEAEIQHIDGRAEKLSESQEDE